MKQSESSRVGCIIMAAGKSLRYKSGNKLLEKIKGKELILYTLEKVCELQKSIEETASTVQMEVLVVTCWDAVDALCRIFDIETLHYDGGPQSETIRKGLQHIEHRNWDGCMFMTGDQPLVDVNSMQRLIDSFVLNREEVHCLCWGEECGNPTIFPSRFFDDLKKLSGDCGGKSFLNANGIKMIPVNANSSWELMDIDTQEELEYIKERFLN